MARRYYAKRKRYGYRGRGDYRSTLRSIGKWGSRLGGAAAGGLFGAATAGTNPLSLFNGVVSGMKQGYEQGSNFSKMQGWGDYWNAQPVGNQIIKGGAKVPMMVNQGKDLTGDVYITHREYIGAVTAKGATNTDTVSGFNIVQYPINAAMPNGFPWLSQIAQNFVLYEFQGLIYEFRPTSGEFGAVSTNAVGKVIIATQYDPDAPRFTDDISMENYDYAMSCKPSIPMRHGVECKTRQKATNMLYCRSGSVSRDKIFTDLGTLCVATAGIPVPLNQAIVNLGELWVTYKVKLSRAQVFDSCGKALGTGRDDLYMKSNASNLCGDTSGGLAALPSGGIGLYYPLSNSTNGGALRQSSTINGTIISTALNSFTYTFPQSVTNGMYMVQICAIQPGPAANGFSAPSGWSLGTLAGFSAVTGVVLTGTSNLFNSSASEATFGTTVFLTINAPGGAQASFTPTTTANCAAGTVISVIVTEVPERVAFGPDYWIQTN